MLLDNVMVLNYIALDDGSVVRDIACHLRHEATAVSNQFAFGTCVRRFGHRIHLFPKRAWYKAWAIMDVQM